MGPPRIFIFTPNFDELGVKFSGKLREQMLPQIRVDSCKQFGFCLQSSSSFHSEVQKTWHRNGLSGLRRQTLAFRRGLSPSDKGKRKLASRRLLHQLAVPLVFRLRHDGGSNTVRSTVVVPNPLFTISHGTRLRVILLLRIEAIEFSPGILRFKDSFPDGRFRDGAPHADLGN